MQLLFLFDEDTSVKKTFMQTLASQLSCINGIKKHKRQQTSQFMFFKEWNELPSCIKDSSSFRDFKKSYLNNIS